MYVGLHTHAYSWYVRFSLKYDAMSFEYVIFTFKHYNMRVNCCNSIQITVKIFKITTLMISQPHVHWDYNMKYFRSYVLYAELSSPWQCYSVFCITKDFLSLVLHNTCHIIICITHCTNKNAMKFAWKRHFHIYKITSTGFHVVCM